jgi:hypothetical protein
MAHEEIFFTIEEMEKKYREYVQALEKLIHVDGEYIVMKLPEGSTDDDYSVHLDRCSTPEAILAWVRSLSEKTWITVPVIHEFVRLATEHHGIKVQIPG